MMEPPSGRTAERCAEDGENAVAVLRLTPPRSAPHKDRARFPKVFRHAGRIVGQHTHEQEAGEGTEDTQAGVDDGEQSDEAACRRGLTTGDLARACATTVRTVRFYEEAGLLCPETRSDGGHRQFGRDDLEKLQLITDLREAGMSLQDIKELFELKGRFETPEQASEHMRTALERQIDVLQKKICVLRRLREELAAMATAIDECKTCDDRGEFPKRCGGCEVVSGAGLTRALRLLWGT